MPALLKKGARGKEDRRSESSVLEQHEESLRLFDLWDENTQEQQKWAKTCRDYKDGKQWTEKQLAVLRRQKRSPVVINRIAPKINSLTGLEIARRTDPKAVPRTLRHETETNAITDAIRYVVDKEDFDAISTDVWEESCLVEGVAGCTVLPKIVTRTAGRQTSERVDENGNAVIVREESIEKDVEIEIKILHHDRVWYDPHSRDPTFDDAWFLGTSTWMGVREAKEEIGKDPNAVENFEEIIDAAMTMEPRTHVHDTHDDRPRNASRYVDRKNRRVRVMRRYWEQDGQWWMEAWVHSGFLVEPMPTGLLDEDGNNICPVILTSGFIDRDNQRYGVSKDMISPQDQINHHRTKEIWWYSQDRLIYEEDFVVNPKKLIAERSKPDGDIALRPGGFEKVRFENGLDKAQYAGKLGSDAKADIDNIAGNTMALAAESSSGRDFQLRRDVGNLEIARLFDQHRRWKLNVYRNVWWAIRQFKTSEWWVRVRDDAELRTGFRFVGLNQLKTKGERFAELIEMGAPIQTALGAVNVDQSLIQQIAQQITAQAQGAQIPPEQMQALVMQQLMSAPVMQEKMIANDVTRLDVDIILDESPDVATVQQEEFEKIASIIPSIIDKVPELTKSVFEGLLENSDLRNKRKWLQLLRQGPDPQEQQMAQMSKQIELAQQKALADAMASQAMHDQARARKAQVEAEKSAAMVQSEIRENEANATKDEAHAMKLAADAGATVGGTNAPA